jgi:hypothetical protein
MPPRSNAPGLKFGSTRKDGTKSPYWIAKQVVRDIQWDSRTSA